MGFVWVMRLATFPPHVDQPEARFKAPPRDSAQRLIGLALDKGTSRYAAVRWRASRNSRFGGGQCGGAGGRKPSLLVIPNYLDGAPSEVPNDWSIGSEANFAIPSGALISRTNSPFWSPSTRCTSKQLRRRRWLGRDGLKRSRCRTPSERLVDRSRPDLPVDWGASSGASPSAGFARDRQLEISAQR